MMKLIQLIIKTYLILFIAVGCRDEECLDIEQLDYYRNLTKDWYINAFIDDRIIQNNDSIRMTLVVSDSHTYNFGDIVYDDCGNSYESESFSIQYGTSLLPVWLGIDIRWSGLENDGFTFSMSYSYNRSFGESVSKNSTYDFVLGRTRDSNSVVKLIEEFELNDQVLFGVLELSFQDTEVDDEIISVFYSKELGVVKLVFDNGNSFSII